MTDDALARWRNNPFFVLALDPDCSRADVERTGQKLLALLAVESAAAKRFTTPFGDGVRTPDGVRAAMAELRDPDRRLVHEAWARVGQAAPESPVAVGGEELDSAPPWAEAPSAIGWRVS